MVTSNTSRTSDQPEDPKKSANALWGGRFDQGPAAIMEMINVSVGFDQRMYRQDLKASKVHCGMLADCGLISREDAAEIQSGLDTIGEEIGSGRFTFKRELEDIHMNVEARLRELIGDAAGRLHTARSRNDQVATAFRLWVRDALDALLVDLDKLIDALLAQAESNTDTIMPGYTHLQTAQPVTFGHHMMAYVEMFMRDRSRLVDARKRMNQSPLGAAALAGTGFPVDRGLTASGLGFDGPTRNSIDSVSDRDFALEFMSTGALIATHLSRIAEEIVIWMSDPFKFITMSDAFTTGSSIMPQKRNPDAAELTRAKTGRIAGNYIALLTVMKGLPLSYSKDMQEDKEVCFDAADSLMLGVNAMAGMVADLSADKVRLKSATLGGHITATDLADWLVRELNMPFRDAHRVTGTLVKEADRQGKQLPELSLEDMRSVEPGIKQAVFDVLTVEKSVDSRRSYGGTAPVRVRAMIKEVKGLLAGLRG